MKFQLKKHDQTLESELEKGSNGAQKYEDMKTEFERNHFKIYDKGWFVREKHDEILFFSARGITESCEHFVCSVINKKGENEEKPFIGLWRTDPNIRIYDTIGCYPNDHYCPKSVFNTWRKFEMERSETVAYKNDELQDTIKLALSTSSPSQGSISLEACPFQSLSTRKP